LISSSDLKRFVFSLPLAYDCCARDHYSIVGDLQNISHAEVGTGRQVSLSFSGPETDFPEQKLAQRLNTDIRGTSTRVREDDCGTGSVGDCWSTVAKEKLREGGDRRGPWAVKFANIYEISAEAGKPRARRSKK
jgi:hypothetical protein